jgi:hypothetical protein
MLESIGAVGSSEARHDTIERWKKEIWSQN